MDIKQLLLGVKGCECGRDHICPKETVEISENASASLKKCVEEYKRILIVYDENTYGAAGGLVESALIGRGDLILASGESAESIRAALVDGYLRVALMYTDGKVADQLRPEALAKSAQCFEKIGQAGRADQMRGELKRLYPTSQWANR